MLMRILPGWLYASLPSLYILAGVLTLVLARHWLALLSGGMLVAAGILVHLMRSAARKSARRPRSTGAPVTSQPAHVLAADDVVTAKWDSAFECGHKVIDRQHRDLVSRANELLMALGGRRSRADIELLIDELIEKLEEHFHTEEAIAEAAAHPDLDAHREIHRTLLAKASGLLAEFQGGKPIRDELASFVADDVLAGHVAHERAGFAAG
jgi:hemerythrin-like metal-binding protein